MLPDYPRFMDVGGKETINPMELCALGCDCTLGEAVMLGRTRQLWHKSILTTVFTLYFSDSFACYRQKYFWPSMGFYKIRDLW